MLKSPQTRLHTIIITMVHVADGTYRSAIYNSATHAAAAACMTWAAAPFHLFHSSPWLSTSCSCSCLPLPLRPLGPFQPYPAGEEEEEELLHPQTCMVKAANIIYIHKAHSFYCVQWLEQYSVKQALSNTDGQYYTLLISHLVSHMNNDMLVYHSDIPPCLLSLKAVFLLGQSFNWLMLTIAKAIRISTHEVELLE